jgi:hypothetical protein
MIKCVPKTYGFAHVCDKCEAVGPIVGDYAELKDAAEMAKLGIKCDGMNADCSAGGVGWMTGKVDLCPKCR